METMIYSGEFFIIPNLPGAGLRDAKKTFAEYKDEAKELSKKALQAHWDKKDDEAKELALKAIITDHLADYRRSEGESLRAKLEKFFGEVSDDEALVEIWVTSPDHDNWTSGDWPGQKYRKYRFNEDESLRRQYYDDRFPTVIPASKLAGVKEGDVITFTMTDGSGREIRLKAAQLDHRYRRFGSFEHCLEELMSTWKTWESGGTIYMGGIPISKND